MTKDAMLLYIRNRKEKTENILNQLRRREILRSQLARETGISNHTAGRLIKGNYRFVQDKTLACIEKWLKATSHDGYEWIIVQRRKRV